MLVNMKEMLGKAQREQYGVGFFNAVNVEMARAVIETAEELRAHYAPWEEMLRNGSTTFPEKPGSCRSECHAWSCAPAWFLLRGKRKQEANCDERSSL